MKPTNGEVMTEHVNNGTDSVAEQHVQ